MATVPIDNDAQIELCPSCGNFEVLDENTGWCADCSGMLVESTIPLVSKVTYAKFLNKNQTPFTHNLVCVKCNNPFDSNFTESFCFNCKEEERSNDIEQLISLGRGSVSYRKAALFVASKNQAMCLRCGNIITNAVAGRQIFCSKQKCQSSARRVKYLRYNKGMAKQDAVDKVIGEIRYAESQITIK